MVGQQQRPLGPGLQKQASVTAKDSLLGTPTELAD